MDDVRVIESGGRPGLLGKADPRSFVDYDVLAENFQGDEAVEACIAGLEDGPHAAFAEFLDNTVMSETLHGGMILSEAGPTPSSLITISGTAAGFAKGTKG